MGSFTVSYNVNVTMIADSVPTYTLHIVQKR